MVDDEQTQKWKGQSTKWHMYVHHTYIYKQISPIFNSVTPDSVFAHFDRSPTYIIQV